MHQSTLVYQRTTKETEADSASCAREDKFTSKNVTKCTEGNAQRGPQVFVTREWRGDLLRRVRLECFHADRDNPKGK